MRYHASVHLSKDLGLAVSLAHSSSQSVISAFSFRFPTNFHRTVGGKAAMCPTKNDHFPGVTASADSSSNSTAGEADWRRETINGGSLRHVDLHTGTNGWASPPGNLFVLRSKHYLSNKTKLPAAADYLLKPTAVDWLRSNSKLEHVLSQPENRVVRALRSRQSRGELLKTFIFAVNLQVPGREHHSAVFYFSTDEPIESGSLLDRFVNEDDEFRNQRFKLVNRIVKGPWLVKKAVGNYSACVLGRALTCRYHRGKDYLEIDVDIASSKIASALLHLALGAVRAVTIDMGFVVEAQSEDELPEKLVGAVRICQMEMSSALYVDWGGEGASGRRLASLKVNHVDGEIRIIGQQSDENGGASL